MRFSLTNILLLIVLIAGAIGTCQWYWDSDTSNYELVFSFYCLLLAAVTAAAIFEKNRQLRQVWAGMTIFGWTFLVLVLRGAFGVQTLDDAFRFRKTCLLGVALMLLSGLATHLWLSLLSLNSARR